MRSEIQRIKHESESQKERISLLESISIARVECDHVPIRVPFVQRKSITRKPHLGYAGPPRRNHHMASLQT